MSGKKSRRREHAPQRPQKVRARDRREIARPRTSRETVAQAVQALAQEEVSERVQQSVVVLWKGIEDRDKALGDLLAALTHVLDETGFRFVGRDRDWLSAVVGKAMALGGDEVCGEQRKEQQ